MELKATQTLNTDVLVVGGGAAGLKAAIEARKHGLDVLLVSESPVGFRNNTAVSGATLAASGIWKGSGDSPEVHLRDTLASGCFINDRKLVDTFTRGATQQIHDLIRFGVNFRRRGEELLAWQIPGHSYPRSMSVERVRGVNITRPMCRFAASMGIRFMEGILVTRLLLSEGTVVGVLGINNQGEVLVVKAKSTILATGGAGQVYFRTNNAIGMTGDGYVLAYEVGLPLRDMEFVQFYPTTFKHGRRVCAYEVLMSRGATIRNSLGEDTLKRHSIDFASMTRDILTRTIITEITSGRGVEGNLIFDLTTMPQEDAIEFYQRGYTSKLPVAPAVHFFMGGVIINESTETGIDGLYAAGEVCGGIHGANRLGSNALTEVLVFGTIAGERAAGRASKLGKIAVPQSEVSNELGRLKALVSKSGKENLKELQQSLKQTMWGKVGIIRDRQGLEAAQREILALREQVRAVAVTDYQQLCQAVKLANMLAVSEMVCRAALIRTESRGAHYRTDYPEEDNERWRRIIEISRQGGEMALRIIPVNGDKQHHESA